VVVSLNHPGNLFFQECSSSFVILPSLRSRLRLRLCRGKPGSRFRGSRFTINKHRAPFSFFTCAGTQDRPFFCLYLSFNEQPASSIQYPATNQSLFSFYYIPCNSPEGISLVIKFFNSFQGIIDNACCKFFRFF